MHPLGVHDVVLLNWRRHYRRQGNFGFYNSMQSATRKTMVHSEISIDVILNDGG